MADAVPSPVVAIEPGHHGSAGSQLLMSEATIATAWNVQGNPASDEFATVAQRITGVALPIAFNSTAKAASVTALWLGPASWLLVASGASPLIDFGSTRDALNAAGGALFDVSSSRVAFILRGDRAADVLASGCPLDFHPRAFGPGSCRQSLFGSVSALYYRRSAELEFALLVARSFARDTWHALCAAAAPYGYTVLERTPFD